MGRGRVQLKRIENKINRQVTFSKRRAGLVKKANEISVLCDAEVALIVFSHKGRLFEYATDCCMEKILERYERTNYQESQTIATDLSSHENWTLEYNRLKAKVELLQRNHMHYMGEDLDSMTQKELANLEQQLENALKHIRSRKNQLMADRISELQKKEKAIQEQNSMLAKQIKEKEKAVAQQAMWEHQNHNNNVSQFLMPHPPLPCLNMGGNYEEETVPEEKAIQEQNRMLAKQYTKEKEKAVAQQAMWEQQNHNNNVSQFLMPHPPLPCLNMGGNYEEEAVPEVRRNELDLNLEPIYSCHLGCFTS